MSETQKMDEIKDSWTQKWNPISSDILELQKRKRDDIEEAMRKAHGYNKWLVYSER